jgi:hypothetical protein
MTEAIQAPSPMGLLAEARGLLELPNLLIQFPNLARQPRGRGQRVLVLPGYGAGDASTCCARTFASSAINRRAGGSGATMARFRTCCLALRNDSKR